ncbi:MAG: response regulator [Betaproteobacteria bacterium]
MGARSKLLIVDDDEAVVEYLRAKLGAHYDIVSTNAPRKVLEIARKDRPNLILCDVDMPDMDGGDVSKELYGDAEVRDIPVLFLTALMTASDLKNTEDQIGGRSAISKQAPPDELVKRIEALTRV